MCAIIGVLGKNLPEQEQFKIARDSMTHRGPDDAGHYYVLAEGIALGHRRLSIIDLSRAGKQPLFSGDGRYGVTFNGEIYNYKELRAELTHDYPFKTKTDTEVILAAYARWGTKSLSRLQGMFAFALWDKEKKTLFVARDRLGIKPLYWAFYKSTFYFSSEVKGILAASRMPRVLDARSIPDYLNYRYPLGDKCFFKGIYSLLPGHFFVVKKGEEPKPKSYWELPVVAHKKDPGEKEALEATEALLKKTVASHMQSDVPVGAYLSGGLDSSVLVGLMSQISSKPVKTFSVGFSEKEFDELDYARRVAQVLKTEHRDITMDAKRYMELLPEVVGFKDAPLHVPNEVPLYALSKELKKNVTVVLSGEGADELFGGYGRIFRSGYDFDRMKGIESLRSFSSHEREQLKANLKEKYGDARFSALVDHLLFQYPYMPRKAVAGLLSPKVFSKSRASLLNRGFIQKELARGRGLSSTEQYMHFFQRTHLLGILGRLDNAAMGASVEGRVPFIDHAFVEHVSALPMSYKMAWKGRQAEERSRILNSDQISDAEDTTKYLLRKVGRKFLPPEIADRKKLSFLVPLDSWLQGPLGECAREMLLSPSARSAPLFNRKTLESWLGNGSKNAGVSSPHGRDVWAALNIELWMRAYGILL